MPASLRGRLAGTMVQARVFLPPDPQAASRREDRLVDLGDRRSAALQQSESFRGVRLAASGC